MGKSLTEVAKAILMNESNDSAPDAGAKSSNPNMATLKPSGGAKGGVEPSPMNNQATLVADAPKKPGEGNNVGAKAATMKQDTSQASPSRKGAVPAMPPQKEVMEEDIEQNEEVLGEAGMMPKGAKRLLAKGVAGIRSMKAKSDKKMADKYFPSKSANPVDRSINKGVTSKAEKAEKLYKRLEEDFELSEELESFINQMIEEGHDEEQIVAAIEENFEFVTEEDNLEISEELQSFIDEMIEEGYDEEQIVAAIEENFEFVTEEDTSEEVEEEAEYDYEVDMNEHVEALFAGEDLSEEFKEKAKTIFEAAVVAKMQSEIARLEEAYAATLEEEIANVQEELSNNVDDYLNYVVEQWVSENEVAIEAGLRTELTEEFIGGLRQLFAEHYIDIPEDKVSVIEELGNKVEELETKLNEEIERNVELTNILSESVKTEIMHDITEGLTTTQAEKLKTLAEGIEFVDAESYATKIQTLRENYFHSGIKAQTELDKIETGTEGQTMISEDASNPMSKYVRALGKTLPK